MSRHQHPRLPATLLALLHTLGENASATKIINLLYLTDEANSRLRGQTITGIEYIRDSRGPNARNNRVAQTLERLASEGQITREVSPLPDENLYRTPRNLDISALPLSGDHWTEIQTAVHNYGHMSAKDLTTASKKTAPFQNPQISDALNLRQDPTLRITQKDIANDPLLRTAIQAKAADTGQRITLNQLRGSVGEPAHI